jgi:hypothetical protein
MDHHFPISTHLSDTTRSAAPVRHELQRDEHHHLPSNRRSRWPLIAAILALLGMLLIFHYVVRGSLQQSELRHQAEALHARAIWRCNNLQGRVVSDMCLSRVNAEARKVALLQPRIPTDAQEGNR